MIPQVGVERVALERFQALDLGESWLAQGPVRHDQELGPHTIASVCFHLPVFRSLIPGGRFNSGLEDHVAPQVQSISDKVSVLQELRLVGILAFPAPLLLDLLAEAE